MKATYLSAGHHCEHCDQLVGNAPAGLVVYDLDAKPFVIHALCLADYCGSAWSLQLLDRNPNPTLEV